MQKYLQAQVMLLVVGLLLIVPGVSLAQQSRTCKDAPSVCDMKLALQRQDLDNQATTIAAMAVEINEAKVEREGLLKRLKELEAKQKDAAASSPTDGAPKGEQ